MLALIDMLPQPRGGIARHSRLLSCLAPFFYAPRIVGEINLGIEEEVPCHIRLPLGKENWKELTPHAKENLLYQLQVLCARSGGLCLAADRRFRQELQGKNETQFIFFGDIFRLILMAALVEHYLKHHAVRRLIFVTEGIPELGGFLDYVEKLGTPVMLESWHPARLEPFCWRILHEKGLAVSCGALRPQEWGEADLIISFQPEVRKILRMSPKTPQFILDDGSHGIAPELEGRATAAGLDGNLAVLAPLLEYYLLKNQPELPQEKALTYAWEWENLIACGKKVGLWSAFLDNGKAGFI